MRINIYAEETTNEVRLVTQNIPETGNSFCGIRFFLESSHHLHNEPHDDDRSAVTFWCAGDEQTGFYVDRLVNAFESAIALLKSKR